MEILEKYLIFEENVGLNAGVEISAEDARCIYQEFNKLENKDVEDCLKYEFQMTLATLEMIFVGFNFSLRAKSVIFQIRHIKAMWHLFNELQSYLVEA